MDKMLTRKNISLLGLLGFIQFLGAASWTAFISRESSSILLGFSRGRLALIILISLLAILCFACSYVGFFQWNRTQGYFFRHWKGIKHIYVVLLIGASIFFLVVFHAPTISGTNYDAYYERLFPFAVSSFLLMVEILGFQFVISRKNGNSNKTFGAFFSEGKPIYFIAIALLVMILFSYFTKFGLVFKTRYWNVPGIPLSTRQFLLAFLLFGMFYFLCEKVPRVKKILASRKGMLLFAGLIYIVTVWVWWDTPLERHYFSLVPSAPNFQPFPYSDARAHDLGALSILMGKGIYFHNYTDKPLLMVIFAAAHLFAGNDYAMLQNVLVVFLAWIPVLIFLLSEKFHSPVLGLFISALILLQQKNAILLSTVISSVNVKLEATETFTLLGCILLALVLFLWAKTKSEKYIFLAGVIIACMSLIRMNPLFYIPSISILILIVFWKAWRQFAKQLFMLFLGFMVVFSPWILTGTNAEGVPWAAVKIIDVIKNRVTPTLEEHQSLFEQNPQREVVAAEMKMPPVLDGIDTAALSDIERTSVFPVDQLVNISGTGEVAGLEETYLYLFANHFFHNVNTVFLSLPDSLIGQDIFSVAHREYFQDENQWNGVLPGKQIFLVMINFMLFIFGLYYGWEKQAWAGLVPAFCMFAYILSISISLTSGGRYIVPINWILYFYFALGIVFLFDFFFLSHKPENASGSRQIKEQNGNPPSWISIIVIVSVISVLIPVSNKLVPLFYSPPMLSGGEYGMEAYYQDGILFYPYYKDDTLSFDLLQGEIVRSFKVPQSEILQPETILQNQERVFFVENENSEITRLKIIRGQNAVLYINEDEEGN